MEELIELYDDLVDSYLYEMQDPNNVAGTLKESFKIKLEKLLEDTKKSVIFEKN